MVRVPFAKLATAGEAEAKRGRVKNYVVVVWVSAATQDWVWIVCNLSALSTKIFIFCKNRTKLDFWAICVGRGTLYRITMHVIFPEIRTSS